MSILEGGNSTDVSEASYFPSKAILVKRLTGSAIWQSEVTWHMSVYEFLGR